MARYRIPDTSLPDAFVDGEVLTSADLNQIVEVLQEGVNQNKIDVNKLLSGSNYNYIADDLAGLNTLKNEVTPEDGAFGFIFDGSQTDEHVEFYRYSSATGNWTYKNTLSIIEPYVVSIKYEQLENQDSITEIGTLFYNLEKHSMSYLSDLGEYVEIGSTLGDFGKNVNGITYEGQPVAFAGVQGASPVKLFQLASAVIDYENEYYAVEWTEGQADITIDGQNFLTVDDLLVYMNANGYVSEENLAKTFAGQSAVSDEIYFYATVLYNTSSGDSLSSMVGVLTTSDSGEGYLNTNSLGKISVFGDTEVPDFNEILDSSFLSSIGASSIIEIPFGTKLYLSTEAGKYSAIPPSRPNAAIWVATVIEIKNNETGRIFVYPQRLRTDGSGAYITISEIQPEFAIEDDLWYDTSE